MPTAVGQQGESPMKRIALLLGACLVLSGCQGLAKSIYGITTYSGELPKSLKEGDIELSVQRASSGDFVPGKDYFARVIVKNVGSAESTFDSSKVVLTDQVTGISFFSIAKDKDNVELQGEAAKKVILRRTLEPGQAASGLLWFPTGMETAGAKSIKLSYGKQAVEIAAD